MKHTDLNIKSGLIACLPARWQSYAVLMRLDRPVGIWLLLLPCWWGVSLTGQIADVRFWYYVVLMGVGSIIMRGAGCVINDLWDRDLDSQVTRTAMRPLASGVIKPIQALFFLIGLLLIGLVILLQFPMRVQAVGVLALGLVILYPFMKRITWWPQAFLGVTFNIGILMGFLSLNPSIRLSVILFYIAAMCWTIAYDTIYAHQDLEDDLKIGIKSTAIHFGQQSRVIVARFMAVCLLLCAVAMMQQFGYRSVLLLLPAAAHMMMQYRRWDIDDPQSCLSVFKSNRDFGLLILAALLGGHFL